MWIIPIIFVTKFNFMKFSGPALVGMLLISLQLTVSGQTRLDTSYKGPFIKPNDIFLSMIASSREYKNADIYKYWGDCPEMIVEYGFKRLVFEDVVVDKNLFHIEMYEMADSVAAFGAYSVAQREAGVKDSLFEYSFHNDREMLFAKGSWYIRIHTLRLDTVRGRKTLVDMAKLLLPRTPGNAYTPPGILTAGQLRQFRAELKLIKGYLGLYYGLPAWEPLFSGIAFSEITVLPLKQSQGELNYGRIVFKDGAELEKFQKKNDFYDAGNAKYRKYAKNGREWIFLRIGENTAILMDGKGESPFLNALMGQIDAMGSRK